MHIRAQSPGEKKRHQPRETQEPRSQAPWEWGAEGGVGTPGTGSRALQSDLTSPGEGGPRGPPPASPTQTPATGVNAEGRPAPTPSPKRNQHRQNNVNLHNSSPDDRGGPPPTRTPRRQPAVPKLVRDAASEAAVLTPRPGTLPDLTCPEKGVHVRVGGSHFLRCPLRGVHDWGRASAGSRAPAKPGAEGGAAPGGRRARWPWPLSRWPRGSGRGRGAGGCGGGGGSAEPPQAAAHGGLGAPAAGSPMVPSPGRWPPAVWPRPGVPAACAPAVPSSGSWLSSPVRLSLLFSPAQLSPLYFSSSLPPSLSPYLLPPSLCSLSLSLSLATSLPAPWLAHELSGSPSGSRRCSSRGSSRTPAPLVRANNDPASAALRGTFPRAPGLAAGTLGATRPSPRPAPALPELSPSYCSRRSRPAS